MKLLEHYDDYKERIIQSEDVKAYFIQLNTDLRHKLMKPELKEHLDKFRELINLDENSQLQLKKQNNLLGQKKGKGRQSIQGDVEMVGPEQQRSVEQGSRKKSRAQFEQDQEQLEEQIEH